jgi:hypothetical protein
MEYLDWDIQWDYLQARAAVDSWVGLVHLLKTLGFIGVITPW